MSGWKCDHKKLPSTMFVRGIGPINISPIPPHFPPGQHRLGKRFFVSLASPTLLLLSLWLQTTPQRKYRNSSNWFGVHTDLKGFRRRNLQYRPHRIRNVNSSSSPSPKKLSVHETIASTSQRNSVPDRRLFSRSHAKTVLPAENSFKSASQ